MPTPETLALVKKKVTEGLALLDKQDAEIALAEKAGIDMSETRRDNDKVRAQFVAMKNAYGL